jgi:DNA processing protein
MADLVNLVALSLLPFWRWRLAAERLRAGAAPGAVLDALADARRPETTPAALRARAGRAAARGAATGLQPIAWGEGPYPDALTAIVDPPFVLWVSGRADALAGPAVALVGSRAASEYARAVASRLGADLAAAGVVVVSGLARGVDAAAHQGALDGGGRTIAVCGAGADVVYPREHARLARAIGASGAVVSELAPGTPPQPQFFPLRNRIISGLSRAVVVVEAGEKSGSLITARSALDQGRDVMAVPGSVLGDRNRGAHALLRDGAKIVETADDILEELGVGIGAGARRAGRGAAPDEPLLACLPEGETCDLDAIAARSGLDAARLLPRLLALELAGAVRRAGGGRFVRV